MACSTSTLQPRLISSFVGDRLICSASPKAIFGTKHVSMQLSRTLSGFTDFLFRGRFSNEERWVHQQGISSFSRTHFPFHLNCLLQNCSASRAIKQGKQVHQQIILHGHDSDPFLITKLIQMYADCNIPEPALYLFDKLPQPNVFAWTAVLAIHLRSGNCNMCQLIYLEMTVRGVRPDTYIFPKVLKACAQLSDLKGGVQIHCDVIRTGVGYSLHVCNALIDMYSKCGVVKEARQVFNEMVERDIVSCNSLISGYVYNGFLDWALELLNLMELEGLQPDLITWNTVMDAYSQKGLCDAASKIFERIVEPNVISWTTLILGYSRSGRHEEALCIFRDMMEGGSILPDSDTLSCVLSSCRYLAALRNGQEIHGYGIKIRTGMGFYDSAGAALVTMYAWCRRIQDAKNVFEMMEKHEVVTWNAMFLGFSHLGMCHSVRQYFSGMQVMGVKYDQITIATILPACDMKIVKQLHAQVIKTHFDVPILVSNALINVYAKSGCIRAAYNIFSNMRSRDVVSWNSMIGGYGMNGQGKAALQLLQEMKQSGIHPNSLTFTSVLSACSHSGLTDEGLDLFNNLTQEFDFAPNMEQFACIVDLLARAGRLGDAADFINKMPFEPDGSVWGSLLAASRVYQDVHYGRIAAENLFSLEPENPGNYVTLSNIYAKAGKWDDAARVRKLMESRGLTKPSGYSWFENEMIAMESFSACLGINY